MVGSSGGRSTVAHVADASGSRRLSRWRFRQLVAFTTVLLTAIVATGAAVRLTGSGLGCDDWPGCTETHPVPKWEFHSWVEFGNRLLSGAAGFPTIALVVAAHRLERPSGALRRGTWWILALVLAQVIVGRFVVELELAPLSVALHYLLSIAILWIGVWLWFRADDGPVTPAGAGPEGVVPAATRRRSWAVVGAALLTVVVGTLVTGAGPHAGDPEAVRLGLELVWVARAHSSSAWLLVATVVAIAVHLGPHRRTSILLAVIVAQGAVGYTQYAIGLPAWLVEIHVIGSAVVFAAALIHHYLVVGVGSTPGRPTPATTDGTADGELLGAT